MVLPIVQMATTRTVPSAPQVCYLITTNALVYHRFLSLFGVLKGYKSFFVVVVGSCTLKSLPLKFAAHFLRNIVVIVVARLGPQGQGLWGGGVCAGVDFNYLICAPFESESHRQCGSNGQGSKATQTDRQTPGAHSRRTPRPSCRHDAIILNLPEQDVGLCADYIRLLFLLLYILASKL